MQVVLRKKTGDNSKTTQLKKINTMRADLVVMQFFEYSQKLVAWLRANKQLVDRKGRKKVKYFNCEIKT